MFERFWFTVTLAKISASLFLARKALIEIRIEKVEDVFIVVVFLS